MTEKSVFRLLTSLSNLQFLKRKRLKVPRVRVRKWSSYYRGHQEDHCRSPAGELADASCLSKNSSRYAGHERRQHPQNHLRYLITGKFTETLVPSILEPDGSFQEDRKNPARIVRQVCSSMQKRYRMRLNHHTERKPAISASTAAAAEKKTVISVSLVSKTNRLLRVS
jgi:hypothetical protein